MLYGPAKFRSTVVKPFYLKELPEDEASLPENTLPETRVPTRVSSTRALVRVSAEPTDADIEDRIRKTKLVVMIPFCSAS